MTDKQRVKPTLPVMGYGLNTNTLTLKPSSIGEYYLENKKDLLIGLGFIDTPENTKNISEIGYVIINFIPRQELIRTILEDIFVGECKLDDDNNLYFMQIATMSWDCPSYLKLLSKEEFDNLFAKELSEFFNESKEVIITRLDYIFSKFEN